MKCEREGCTTIAPKGQTVLIDVYDERRAMATSGKFAGYKKVKKVLVAAQPAVAAKPAVTNKKGEVTEPAVEAKPAVKEVAEYDAIPAYAGHNEHWCFECVRLLEPDKYRMEYYVKDSRLKLRRTKRAQANPGLTAILPDPVAPILEDDVVETLE